MKHSSNRRSLQLAHEQVGLIHRPRRTERKRASGRLCEVNAGEAIRGRLAVDRQREHLALESRMQSVPLAHWLETVERRVGNILADAILTKLSQQLVSRDSDLAPRAHRHL